MKRFLPVLLLVTACASEPVARRVQFESNWVRSALMSENYGFRHAERTAPLIDSGFIFQGNGHDGLVAYDQRTGNKRWHFAVEQGIESGLCADKENVFFGASDGQFYAVNKISGKAFWTFPTRSENLGPALVENGVVYFQAGNNILYALDAKTGKQLWSYNRGDASTLSIRGAARPTLYKNTLYVGFSDGFLAAINAHDGTLAWERKISNQIRFVDVDATAVVEEELIWISSFDGALYCMSRSDGQVLWRLDDGGAVAAVVSGETLYYGSTGQNVYALNKRTGEQKWKYSYPEKYGVPTQPLLYKGLVIFGTSDGDLVALNESTGKQVGKYRTGNGIFATPALDLDRGEIYVYSNQANIYALRVSFRRPGDEVEWTGRLIENGGRL